MASDVRQKSDYTSVNRAVQEELDRSKGSECTNWSQSRSSSHKTLPGLGQASTSISESQGHYDESTKVTSNTLVSMANSETNFKATDEKGTSKPQPIDSAHTGKGEICADEQPVSSVSTSSPQPLSTYDESFAPDEGGNTPSTIAYTHSSAMDDEDEDLESEEDRSASKKVRKHKNVTEFKLDNSGHSSEYSSYSTSDEPASVENSSFCSPRSRLSSPSSLSAHSERGDLCSATESSDLDGQENEDGTSILSQFTTHLGKILRRVEELDLLKLASPTTTGEHKRHKSDHVAESSDSACIPEAARLSRHELSVLYTESAKVRLNGSMFTIPTGRLVRFLTLLLVNMQEGAHTSPSPVSTTEAIQYLERRLRLHSHRQGGSSRRPHASQLTESVLWCNSKWASVLTGLDCARIALNIIVGPDMPRPLLMEDLIDGIVAVVRRQLDNTICKPFVINASRSSGNASNCGLSAQQLENFTAECVGFRISQIVAVLNSLIRFQPNRFTDNLVIHLTGLGLAIPLYSLSTGQSIERDIKRFSTPIFQQLLSGPFSSREHGATNSPYPLHVGPSIFWLAVWPSHLQRASLGLLAAIYSQYEAHRKLILDEIFSNIVAHCAPTSSTSSKSNDGTRHSPPIGNGSRYSTRTFSLLSSKWFFEENTLRKHAAMNHRKLDDSDECVDCDSGAKRAPRSVGVHALSALFLSLVQGLVQIPSSFSNSSSSGGSGTNSRKGNSSVSSTPVASHGIGEPLITETNQFYRDEKYVLTSYNTSLRHAHYLLSGLLKKMSTKIESDLRPLLETITSDLLEVVVNAPVEWPAACTLLSVLGGLLIQQLSQANPSTTTNSSSATSTSARTADLSSKLLSLDTLATLAIGIKKIDQKLGSSHLAGYKLVADKHSLANEKQVTLDDTSQNSTTAAKLRAKELLAKVRLLAFLSSPTSALHHWLVAPEYMYVNASQASVVGESTIDVNSAADGFRNQERQCLKLIRLEYSDCLVLAAHRFHLASWIHNCTRELGELVSSSNNTSKTNSDGGGSANILKPTTSKRARELEQLRHQLLSELALTHYSLPSSLPWLTCSKQNGTVGSSSLSSPVTCKFGGRTGTNSQANGRSNSANQLVGYGGSILANNLSCERFIRQAHSCHANKQNRIRIAAHAHWSAVLLLYLHPVVPGFQKLFTVVCRLAGEASVPVRTKALRCLSNIIEVDPDLLTATDSDSEMVDGGLPRSSLLRLVHARLLDHSTAVREAAVDLVSRLLSLRPHALSQYYPMLAERVLDKGVSVRKRTIRCFRELLLSGWEFGDQMKGHPKHRSQLLVEQTGVEMSIKLIRRLHDEESIQKLVEEFFQILWFSPIPDSTRHWSRLLDQRILNLSSVILMLRCSSFDFLESFIKQVLSAEGPIKKEQMNSACEQMVDRLMTLIKRLVASLMSSTPRDKNKKFLHKASSPLQVPTLLSLLASLHLLSRCMPNLIQRHCDFLLNLLHKAPLVVVSAAVGSSSANHPNPDLEPPTGLDPQCLFHLVSTIEMSLLANESQDSDYRHHSSINDHISKTKLYELQADLLHLIQRQGRLVVDSSLSCLATLSNQVLCDHTEVATCFSQFYGLLLNLSLDLRKALSTRITNSTRISSRTRPSVLRALYTVGLMCKHFPLDDLVGENKRVATSSSSLLDEVLDTLMLFAEYAAAPVASHSATETSLTPSKGQTQINDADLCRKAMMGLGFVVSRHDQLLCTKRLRTFFLRFFINAESPATSPSSVKPSPFHEIQCIILDNLTHYLIDSERQMIADSRSWSAKHKSESLKELADQRSGHGSAVAQEYLPIVLDYCILTPNLNVRTAALGLISVILRQGLVHPVQTLPSLICLQADPDPGNRSRASHLLGEIDKKFSGFIAMRATSGLQMAYELHLLLQSPSLEFDQNPHSPLPLIRGATQDSCFSPQNSTIAGSTIASHPVALNHAVYALLRSNRQSRRSFINNLLSLFDTEQGRSLSSTTASPSSENSRSKRLQSLVTKCPLGRLVFITDQLAHFPYVLQDEIFYVSYYAEQRASVSGSSLLRLTQRTFLSSLLSGHCSPHKTDPSGCARKDISGDRTNTAELESYLLNLMETAESKLINRRSKHESTDDVGSQSESASDRLGLNELQHLLEQSQPPSLREKLRLALVSTGPACLLLLTLRHHMREFYGVSDGKLKDYSPSDCPKQWDKPIVQPKRPNPSDPMLRLPSLVLHCLKHPEWQDATKTPSNTFVLTQLIRLRHQLLALEENGQCTDFPSQELNEQQQKQECNSSVINPQSSTFSSPADKIMDSSFERGQNLSTKFQTKNSEKRTSKHGSSSIEGSPAANSSTSAKNPDDLKSVVVEHEHQCSPPNKSNPKLKFPTSSGKSQAEFPLSSSSAHKRRAPPTPSISSSSLSSSSPSSTTSSDSGSSSEAEGLRRAQKLHTSNASRVTKAKPSAGGTGSVQKMVSEGHANRTPLHKVKSHGNDLTQKAKHAHHPKENEAARVSKRAYSSSGLDSDDSDSVVTSAVHTERKATNTQQSQLHSRREFPGVRSSSHIPHKEVRKHGDTHVRRDTSQLSTTSSAHKADRSDRRNKPKKHVMAAGSASATTHPHASDSTTHKSKKSPVVSSAATSRDSERSAMHSLHKAAETTRHSDGSGIRKPTKTKINGNQPVGVGRSLAPLPQAMMKSNVPHRPSHKRPSAQMAQNIKKYPKEKSSSPSADYPRHHRSHQTKDSKSLPSYNNAVASTSNCDTMQPKPRPHPPKASNNNASSANSMGSGSSDIASQRARNSSSKPAKSVSPRHTQRVRRLSESSSLSPDTDDEDKCSFTSSTSVSSVSTPSDSSLSSSSSSDPPPAKLKHKSSVR
ncbi:unnamed protein product [Calicophoron daubneyi]|uniref:Nipped-B protein n=1 Tax=Calicophoron daubneyi TaxID=300641 RepID=A0AAV2TXR5_CALDB